MNDEKKEKLLQLFTDMVGKYEKAENEVIWEASTKITESLQALKNEIIEAIDKFKAELYSSDWIPCSERLPEDEGYYLTSIEDEVRTYNFDPNDFADVSCWLASVGAWMPLPEPYKGE